MFRSTIVLMMTACIAISCGGDEDSTKEAPGDSKSETETSSKSPTDHSQPSESKSTEAAVREPGSLPVKVKGPMVGNDKIVSPNGQKAPVPGVVVPGPLPPPSVVPMAMPVPMAVPVPMPSDVSGEDTPPSSKEASAANDLELTEDITESTEASSTPAATTKTAPDSDKEGSEEIDDTNEALEALGYME